MSSMTAQKDVHIAGRAIGKTHSPFVIAEMSGNHNQSLERALAIVEAAAKAGADAVKLQTYTADTMTLNLKEGDFFIGSKDLLWQGSSLYELYEQAHTPWEWHATLMERCAQLGLICFSSPFDSTAVDFLESLKAPAYKIASFEIVDLALIRRVAATGKPLLISTGMATEEEVADAVETARAAGCCELILLKCTSSYPATPGESNLMTVPYLQNRFQVQAGISDHTAGIGVAIASVALGATVIEKHFTLSRDDGGVDAAFSLDQHEMSRLVVESRSAHQALGTVRLAPTENELPSWQFRRSLYIVEDIPLGGFFTVNNLRSIRPGYGLSPKFYGDVIGKRSTQALAKGTALSFDHVDGWKKL